MISEIVYTGLAGLVLGIIIGKKFKIGQKIKKFKDREIQNIVKDPQKLKEKLEKSVGEGGSFVDMGEKINLKIKEKDGVQVLDFERVKEKEEKPVQEISKKKKK